MLFHAGKVREIQFPGRKLGEGDYYISAGNRNVTVGVEVGVHLFSAPMDQGEFLNCASTCCE